MPTKLSSAELRDDAEAPHVFDLPQLYTKPSAGDILRALERLAVHPRVFDHDDQALVQNQIHTAGACQYLTSIISSALAWLDSDELREEIWEAASTRLCERSGRSAMPSMSRTFMIPMTQSMDFPVTLHEPSLTSDNLGMKTWLSSYLLAKRLHKFLVPPSGFIPTTYKDKAPLRALELGAGTGLVGLSFAALWGSAASVHLTDLDPIVPNLTHNVGMNEELLSKTGGSASTGVLDWSLATSDPFEKGPKYDVVLAADPLYSPEHPRWLVQTIGRWLSPDAQARVIIEMPLRSAYSPQVTDFKQRMHALGLRVIKEGEETGYDDWETSNGGSVEVHCWWSVWAWNALSED